MEGEPERPLFFSASLSEEFLVALLTDPEAIAARSSPGVQLDCAYIPFLDLSERSLPGSLRILRSWLSYLDLTDARIDGTLSLNNSYVANRVAASGLEVRRNLYGVDLRVESNLRLSDAQVGGFVMLRRAKALGSLEAWRIEIGKTFFLDESEFGAMELGAAEIGGNLEADGSTFTGLFNAERLKVSEDAYLRGGASFEEVRLAGAHLAGHLQLQGSKFNGKIDLSEATFGSLLLWRSGENASLGDGARLTLRNAQAGSLQARMGETGNSWMREDGTALPADLTGFRYDLLGGFSSGVDFDLGRIKAEPLINWVETSEASGLEGYNPQPYRALETAMRNMGTEAAATQVAYARLAHRATTRIDTSPTEDFLRWARQVLTAVFDRVLQVTIGFGVYPQWAFYWFLALVGAGTVTARGYKILPPGESGKPQWGDCLFYSLENAIPLMEPSCGYSDIRLAHYVPRMVFNFQKVMEFVLASVLLGALTLGAD